MQLSNEGLTPKSRAFPEAIDAAESVRAFQGWSKSPHPRHCLMSQCSSLHKLDEITYDWSVIEDHLSHRNPVEG
jgi:hypothetical protein